MKLFSSQSNRNPSGGQRREQSAPVSRAESRREGANNRTGSRSAFALNKTGKKKMSRGKKALMITLIVIGAALLILTAIAAIIRWEIQPLYSILVKPIFTGTETAGEPGRLGGIRTPRPDPNNPDAEQNIPIDNRPLDEVRNVNQITFLILGVDGYRGIRSEGGGNTDAIMIASFDMDALTMEVASIPRDTIVNVSWDTKKINSIYAVMRNRHGWNNQTRNQAMQDTMDYFADFLGFNLDYWVTLDMAGFEALVDAIGGVRFNVPYSIRMRENEIGMNVQIAAGEQLLNGMQALAVVRDRSHGGGDFTRMETQGSFLKTVAEQILANRSSINVTDYANLLLRHIQTNMELNEMIIIGREMLKLDNNNINFVAATGTVTSIAGGSYVYIHLDEWLEIVNTKLSPFYDEITPQHVSILTRGADGRLYVTDDNWQASRNWGSR